MLRSKHDRPQANRVFTDREGPIALFDRARSGLDPDRHHLLAFHGVGGQGKTALRKQLARILAGETPRKAVWGVLDFEVFDTPARGLLELRKTLRESGPIRFAAFDVAIAAYWEKAYPTEDVARALKDLLSDHEGVLGSIADNAPDWLDLAQDLPAGLGLGVKALLYVRKKFKDGAARRQIEALQGVEQLDAVQLLDKLPYFLAVDLRAHRERDACRPPILFLDTYEALWSDKPDKTGLAAVETDGWVRELVAAAPGALFVIFGRDRLAWDRRFPEDGWGDCLGNQHRLDGLAEEDADRFLRQIPVEEADLRAAMIEAAQGEGRNESPAPSASGPAALPFCLDLLVDAYLDIKASGRTPRPEDFGGTHGEIVARFLRHRTQAEQETLKVLAGPRAFDRELFQALIERFKTGYPLTAWEEFTGFSFVEPGPDGRLRLHALMREHLREALDDRARAELQAFLFDWFDARCQPASPRDIARRHEWALREAVYHRDLTDAEAALDWFWARSRVFYEAARYEAIEPLYRWAVELAEDRLGPDHPKTAVALNDLAQLLEKTSRLAEAEPLMRRAMSITEKSLGAEHPHVAIRLNNLAQLLQDTQRLAEAEPLMRRALAITEKSFGPEHPDVAIYLNNLAMLLQDTLRLAEAEPLMRRALAIDEKSFGLEHPTVAIDLNNLTQLLQAAHRLLEAEPLMRRALAITEKSFGPEHPEVANRLNNLTVLLMDTNRMAEAEPLLLRALGITERSLGPEHPKVGIRLKNLGRLYQATSRKEQAYSSMWRALVIFLKFTQATGHEHPKLRTVFGKFQDLLQEFSMTQEETNKRLARLGAEAGWDGGEWRAWLEKAMEGGA